MIPFRRLCSVFIFAALILQSSELANAAPAGPHLYHQWVDISAPSGKVQIKLDYPEGLICGSDWVGQFKCALNIDTNYDFSGLSLLNEEKISKEVGNVEIFLSDYINGKIIKSDKFNVANREVVYVKVPGIVPWQKHIITGTITNPSNLRVWIRTTNGAGKIDETQINSWPIPVTYDEVTQSRIDAQNQEKIALEHPGMNFYPNLGLEGEWRYPENRQESGECEFGYQDGDGSEDSCTMVLWEKTDDSDGFSSSFSVSIDSGDDEFDTGGYSNLEITCSAKKLSVNVYLKYPSSFGWKGSGQYRFDSGSGKKFTYRVDRSFDSFWLDNPKAFTSAFLRAKSKASFKVSNQYLRILVFPKSNLNIWAPKFKASGCPLV